MEKYLIIFSIQHVMDHVATFFMWDSLMKKIDIDVIDIKHFDQTIDLPYQPWAPSGGDE